MDENKQIYLTLLDRNRESRIRESSRRDHLIATVSGGTLVLSVTFLINTVFRQPLPYIEYLFVAWGFLILSLISSIMSYVFGDFYFVTRRAVLRQAYKRNDIKDIEEYKQNNPWRWVTHGATYLAVFSTVAGLIIFAYFGYMTIRGLKSNTEPIQSGHIQPLSGLNSVLHL